MKTPWGELAVSDAHVHFLSQRFYDALAAQKGAPITSELSNLRIEVPEGGPDGLAERWVKEFDRHGLESAAMIASVPADEDSVLQAVRKYPERFFGYFLVEPTKADAVTRVTAAMEAGLHGTCFFPAMHRYAMYDDRVTAILEAIKSRPGTVVFVHCGVLSVGIRRKLGVSSQFDMRFSNPVDVHGIALRYPQLTFVIPHFGAGYLREALMLGDLCPNVYFDTSSSNEWVKYQVPPISVRDAFRRSLDVIGAHRLLFGTDSSFFPRGWVKTVFEAQSTMLFDLGIGTDDAELIFGANLRRILRRPRE
jgi:predicted TIM-barrel fold metal-dependent hydrolase